MQPLISQEYMDRLISAMEEVMSLEDAESTRAAYRELRNTMSENTVPFTDYDMLVITNMMINVLQEAKTVFLRAALYR